MLEGVDFYLQHFNLGGAQRPLAWSPPFPQDPALPMLPTKLLAKSPKSLPRSYFKSGAQFFIVFALRSPFLRSSSFLQDVEYVSISLCVIVQESMCRVFLDHSETGKANLNSQGRNPGVACGLLESGWIIPSVPEAPP